MNNNYTIINGNSIDCIITDPPYELNFMNKGWDNSGIAFNKDVWNRCLRVLKHGGYLLAFGGTRTFHRIACAIEDAGFEIRDTIMWLYGSGFPKSLNIGLAIDKKNGCGDRGHRIAVANRYHPDGTYEPNGEYLEPYEAKTEIGKKWQGWGTALKPAYEPIIVARKPIEKTIAENVMKYGVGGLNIDECRVETTDVRSGGYSNREGSKGTLNWITNKKEFTDGRYPSNVILTYDDTDYNEVCGGMPDTKSVASLPNHEKSNCDVIVNLISSGASKSGLHYGDEGNASRYYYCAKASKKDRDEGLEIFESQKVNDGREKEIDNAFQRGESLRKNVHPTVKPTELMQYLIRLVAPKGATILDCFMGSGSTGKAVAYENKEYQKDYKFIGIELSKEYCEIAKARIEYASKYNISSIEKETKERKVAPEQMSIFDLEN